MLWLLMGCLPTCPFVPCLYFSCYVTGTKMIIRSDVHRRNIAYFVWWRVVIVRDIIVDVYCIYVNMDCDSLTSLLLSMSDVSWSKVRTRVEDVSSMISIGIFRPVDWRVPIRGCCASDLNSGCCAPILIYIKCSYIH